MTYKCSDMQVYLEEEAARWLMSVDMVDLGLID